MAAAGLAIGRVDRARDLARDRGEAGLGREDTVAIEHPQVEALVAQQPHVVVGGGDTIRRAEIVQQPLTAIAEGDARLLHDRLQLLQGIGGEAQLEQGIAPGRGVGALAEELQRPQPQGRVEPQLVLDPQVAVEERAHRHLERVGRSPGIAVGRGVEPGIAVARFHRRPLAPLDDDDLVPIPGQRVGGGHADDAGADDGDLHGRACPATVRCLTPR